ncbi:histidine kinase [Streptosporangium sp. NPDC051023]|uniref:histidine kinase n=1 Tax=Streptosporangium sp. NPDC051023 TaxID=3155410 RepID=UPI00344F1A76
MKRMRKDALWALACFVGGLAMLAAGAYSHRPTPGYLFLIAPDFPETVPAYVLTVPLLITCLGVAVRRRSPVGALALGLVAITADLLVGYSLATVVIFTDNLYSATLYGPARLGRWLLGVSSVLSVVGGAVIGFIFQDLASLTVAVAQFGLVGVTPVSTALIVRQFRTQAESERARAEQVARLAELDRRAAVNAERTRMARELHDMIANHFSAIAIQSTAVLSRRDLDAETVRGVLESIRENSVQGMAEMRAMIGLLRQDGEEVEATRRRVAEADQLAARAREAGLEVRLRVEGEARELPAAVDLAGYRIIQESLTNALKHGGEAVDLVIGYRPGVVTLIADNPVGDARRQLSEAQETASGAERELSHADLELSGAGREIAGAELGRPPVSPELSGPRRGIFEARRRFSEASQAARGLPEVGQRPHGVGRSSAEEERKLSRGRHGPHETGRRLSDGVGWGSRDPGRTLPSAGAGIVGMRERAALVGGSFEAGPYEGGWRVQAELPTGEIL